MTPWPWLLAGAWAQGMNDLVVEVRDPLGLVQPPLAAELVARGTTLPLELRDDGQPPDRAAGDGAYSAALSAPRAPSALLHVWDAAQRWEGTAGFSDDHDQTILASLARDGQLRIAGSADASPPGAERVTPVGVVGTASLLATLPWSIAAAGFAAALVLLWRRESSPRPRALPPPTPGEPAGLLRVRPGPEGLMGLIACLARRGPLLVAGPVPPGIPPHDTVATLDDPLPRTGDVVAAWRALAAGGARPAVLLTGPVEALAGSADGALDELARLLPGVPLIIPDPAGAWKLDPGGRPVQATHAPGALVNERS